MVLPAGDWTASVSEGQRWYWLLPGHLSPSDHVTISGFEHSWALVVGLQLFLVWPLVIMLGGLRALAVTGFLSIGFHALMLVLGTPASTVYHVAPTWIGAFTAGSLLAFLWRSEWGLALVRQYRAMVFWVTTAGLITLVLARHGFVAWDPVVVDVGVEVIVLWFAVLIASSMLNESRADHYLCRFVNSRCLQFLGRHAFLIYLLHFPIHRLLSNKLALLPSGSTLLNSSERLGYVVLVLALSAAVATLLRKGLLAFRMADR
jgi:peptidoglycan/LPS O-acetylase OafA/YrhL